MAGKYKLFSFFYDLIDVLYFNREQYSPRRALVRLIPDTPVRVLDVCAGTGSNSLMIASHKAEAKITALDLSADMLKIADKKFSNANISNVKTIIADACNTGLDDHSFDVILLSLVLHELSGDLRRAILSEARRIIKNDGRIIIIEWEQPEKPFQRFMFSLIKQMEPNGFIDFLSTNLAAYFRTLGLTVLEKYNCDYTQIFVLSKE